MHTKQLVLGLTEIVSLRIECFFVLKMQTWNKGCHIRTSDKHLIYYFSIGFMQHGRIKELFENEDDRYLGKDDLHTNRAAEEKN